MGEANYKQPFPERKRKEKKQDCFGGRLGENKLGKTKSIAREGGAPQLKETLLRPRGKRGKSVDEAKSAK